MLIGCIQVILGLALWGFAISVGITWIGFCFGTVIIGILLLIFAPHILLLPPALIATPANGLLFLGWNNLSKKSEPVDVIDSDAIWEKSSKNLDSIKELIESKQSKNKE